MTKQFILALFLAIGSITFAQNLGSVSGKIMDAQTKQPLPGANIIIVGSTMGTASGDDGTFSIDNLNENVYKLKISYIGYNTLLKTDVRVIRGKENNIGEIELIPAAISEEEVVVKSSLFNDSDMEPVSRYSYSKDEIYRSPGAAGDVLRAVETLPGVSSSGGEFSAFSVRGGSPQENIILIDNIPFDKVTHFEGGSEEQEKQGGRFSIFVPNLIDKADFQAGGYSAAYGGKLSSYLDLAIKEGNTENFTIDGRYDIIGWEMNYDGPTYLLENSGMVLSARRSDFTTILDLTDDVASGEPSFYDFVGKFTFNPNPENKISLLAIYAPEEFNRDLKHVLESEGAAASELTDQEEKKYLMGLNWRYLTGAKSYLQTSVYYRATDGSALIGRAIPTVSDKIPTNVNELERRNRYISENQEYQTGIKSSFSYTHSNNFSFSTGIEVNNFSLVNKRTLFGTDTLFVFDKNDFRASSNQNYILRQPIDFNADYDENNITGALYGETTLRHIKNLTLNTGIRLEYNQFNEKMYVSPRISAAYRINTKTRLNFATGIYYQDPDLEVITDIPTNNILLNEKSVHLIAGVTRYMADDIKLNLEGYYKSFDDLIVREDRTTQNRNNNGEGWAAGFDVSLVKRFVNNYYGQINYSYSVSKRNDNNGEGEYNSDFNQPHIFNILLGYEFNKEWAVSVKWKYAVGRPSDAYVIHNDVLNNTDKMRYAYEITKNNSERLPDFHTLNFRVDYRKQLGRFAIVSYLDVVNLYNHKNINEEKFQDLNGKFEDRGFGILPTLGIKVEF